MQYSRIFLFFFTLFLVQCSFSLAQQKDSLRNAMSRTSLFTADSARPKDSLAQQQTIKSGADTIAQEALKPKKDTFFLFRKKYTPKGATLRSLILPGWGQAYIHQYWMVPVAVAAVGIPLYLYFDNTAEYHRAQFAYNAVFQSLNPNNYPGASNDPSNINKMDKKFLDYYNAEQQVYPGDQGKIQFLTSVQSYRNSFRQYRDYSILFTVLLWGAQVAEATVFAHLREFNVTPDLSMKVSPAYFPLAKVPGVTLNFSWK